MKKTQPAVSFPHGHFLALVREHDWPPGFKSQAVPPVARVTQEDAERQRLGRFFTGEPCHAGHVAQRYVSSGNCCECTIAVTRARYEARKAVAA